MPETYQITTLIERQFYSSRVYVGLEEYTKNEKRKVNSRVVPTVLLQVQTVNMCNNMPPYICVAYCYGVSESGCYLGLALSENV